ncbi:MAG: protein kinase [Akkermansiaceae bacterium]|nr:protein kinase [Akkermansiaceae bacterium]
MVSRFALEVSSILADKYEVVSMLGRGWEGEVYKIKEVVTQVERAAKIFYPQRNLQNKSAIAYAQRLHRLRKCPVMIGYHSCEKIEHDGEVLTLFVSEYVEGELLTRHLSRYRGGRLALFQGLHLLHALAKGVENMHNLGEYHGDLHSDNIIVQSLGVSYNLKLLDLFNWGKSSRSNQQHDICCMIRVFYDAIGGARYYARHPQWVRDICCGLKKTLIARKFKSAEVLVRHLESIDWAGG